MFFFVIFYSFLGAAIRYFGNINIPSSQATLHSALPPFKRDSLFKFLILKRLAKYKN